jgi:hypothetical protein
MDDEKPITIKRRKVNNALDTSSSLICVLHVDPCTDSIVKKVTDTTLTTIRKSAELRQCQTDPAKRMDAICKRIPTTFDADCHGFHRSCYQKINIADKR